MSHNTTDLVGLLAPRIQRAREIVAAAGSLDEAIGELTIEIQQTANGPGLAAIALIQLAADEDSAGVTR